MMSVLGKVVASDTGKLQVIKVPLFCHLYLVSINYHFSPYIGASKISFLNPFSHFYFCVEREGWKGSRDRQSGRATNRSSTNDDTKPRDVKTGSDGSYKVEYDSKQTSRRRPSFRETKILVDSGIGDKSATQTAKIPEGSERKEERGKPIEKSLVDQPDRRLSGERDPHRTEMHRMKFQSRERYGGGGNGGFGGSIRGRNNGRQGQSGGLAEKWKHDLYDEANKSPTSRNEEDQIAKVEALLAS